MQSLICLLAQDLAFDSASQVMKKLLHIDLSAKQFQRVIEWYGAQIDPIVQANHEEYMPRLQDTENKEGHTYVIVDACFLFTREEQWKEDKLARIFHSP